MARAALWILWIAILAGAALARDYRLKHLLDPLHEDFRLEAWAWDQWEDLDKATRLRAKGTDPAEWEEPPPEPETEEERKAREEREAEEARRQAAGQKKSYPKDRVPGFKFDDLLKERQEAFEKIIQPASPSKLEGLIKKLDLVDKMLARYDRTLDEIREDYEQIAEQRAKAEQVYVENYKKRHGKLPKQVRLPVSLIVGFQKSSLALQRALARRQAVVQFHDWLLVRLGQLVDELTEDEAKKPLRALARGVRDKDWAYRLRCAELLARVKGAKAAELFRDAMDKEDDPLVLSELIRIRSARGGEGVLDVLKAKLLDERWPVRAAAVRALASLRSKEAIDVLVLRMKEEDGRLLDDIAAALRRVTGQKFRSEPAAWKAWWRKAREGWRPPQEATAGDEPAEGQRQGVVYFYGIQTSSKRVVFCIDVSGSMDFPLDGRDGKKPPRIETAKRELVQALTALPEDAKFSIVVYNAEVDVWKRRLQSATLRNKQAARKFVDRLEPAGATNIFDALVTSIEVAVEPSKRKHDVPDADTIFFLTDGRPTNGKIVDPHQILDEVTRRNRLAGLVIHTIGVSKDQNRGFLLNLAKKNGGRYVAHK